MSARLWWVLWSVPYDVPDEDMLETWPAGMRGWCTGGGDDYATWAGAAWAPNEDAALKLVLSCYGKSAGRVQWRGEPALCADDWQPGDRFPGAMPEKPHD